MRVVRIKHGDSGNRDVAVRIEVWMAGVVFMGHEHRIGHQVSEVSEAFPQLFLNFRSEQVRAEKEVDLCRVPENRPHAYRAEMRGKLDALCQGKVETRIQITQHAGGNALCSFSVFMDQRTKGRIFLKTSKSAGKIGIAFGFRFHAGDQFRCHFHAWMPDPRIGLPVKDAVLKLIQADLAGRGLDE